MKNKAVAKQSIWHIIKNNVWILRFVVIYAPSLIVVEIVKLPILVFNTFISINFTRWIIESIEKKVNLKTILILIIGISIFIIITNLLLAISSIILAPQKKINLGSKLREKVIEKVGRINQIDFQSNNFFDMYKLGLNEIDNRAIQVLSAVFAILGSCAGMLMITQVTADISNGFAVFGIIAALVDFGLGVIRQKYNYRQTLETNPDGRRRGYVNRITYQPEFIEDIKIYPRFTQLLIEKYRKATHDVKIILFKFSKKIFLIDQVQQVLAILFKQMLPWIYIVILLAYGQISIAETTVLAAAALQIPNVLAKLLNNISTLYMHSLYIENLKKILNYKEDIERSAGITLDDGGLMKIQIEDIFFAYNSYEKNVIEHLSMEINNGDKIAIVGYNGAGKSTLVKLLIRLYDTNGGHIYINGDDICQINTKSLRSKIVLLSQDFKIYSFSIAENVLMRPVVGDEDIVIVENALKKVGLYEKISSWEHGIHTPITREFDENGKYLSGGEMQKLSLARIYAGDYDCVILDESTGALDPVSEDEIIQTIFEIFQDKTIVMISHRLVTVKYVERIYFMADGQVCEEGTHQELMTMGGEYYKFYSTQVEKYQIE